MKRGRMQGPLILDRYRPIETKGTGASGRVDLCWDTRIQRRVAIKRMPISNAGANGWVPGLAEARTGAMLNRPSIVSVYDFDVTDSEAFLIMEAIEGPTLADLLHNTPPGLFDLDIAAAVLAAVGDAIEFAHENQVLHLDIKPENILITKGGACKVSDFGVSELADAQGFGKASGGTIGYMPLEQMRHQELDERCDEFALAAVAYEIITGKRPFAARSIDASEKRIEKFDLEMPSSLRDDVDPGMDSVFFAALCPDKSGRYESVGDFMDALMPYLGNPSRGAARLKEIVDYDDELYEDDAHKASGNSFWERISPRVPSVLGRVVATALCWWVTAFALFNIPALSIEVAMLIALLPAVGGAVKPTYGTALALLVNGAALFFNVPASPIVAIIALAAAIAWFFFFGHEGARDANCALAISPLSLIGFSPIAPMLAGLCLPKERALGAAGIQATLLLSAGQHTGPELLFGGIMNVSTWIIIAGWIVTAVLMSLFCSRGSRVLGVIGAVVAACMLLLTQSVAALVLTGTFALPNATWTITTLISCAVVAVMCILDVPIHHEGD